MPASVASGIVTIAASSTGPRRRHPFAAAQIVHQHQRHAAERQAEPEQIGAEPGAKEAGGSMDRAMQTTQPIDAENERGTSASQV